MLPGCACPLFVLVVLLGSPLLSNLLPAGCVVPSGVTLGLTSGLPERILPLLLLSGRLLLGRSLFPPRLTRTKLLLGVALRATLANFDAFSRL